MFKCFRIEALDFLLYNYIFLIFLSFPLLEQEKQLPVLGAAIALYQWKARNDNELSFSKGDTIEILEQLEMRWKVRC